MSAVTFNQRCACGAEFVATIEDDGMVSRPGVNGGNLSQSQAVDAIDYRMKRWEKAHKAHTAKDAPEVKPPMGFRTSAIASVFYDGEDDGSDEYDEDEDDD